jgi:hypothetical protein
MKPASLVVLVFALACGPIPGGSLDGAPAEVPSDWSAAMGADHALCEIESRPADPHSIQLECFVYEGQLHAQSHRWALASWWPVESWAAIWIAQPDVKVRLDDDLFELRAVQITDPAQRDAILRFRGYEPPPDGIVVFRFDRPDARMGTLPMLGSQPDAAVTSRNARLKRSMSSTEPIETRTCVGHTAHGRPT